MEETNKRKRRNMSLEASMCLFPHDVKARKEECSYKEFGGTDERCCGLCVNGQFEDVNGFLLCCNGEFECHCSDVCDNFKM